ncbi:Crp/Fnr family transcriptional regulator [Scytonema sp. NUACC26]|uniref:Crp/Fnr family transcriptional regulator n=1 Tax=Scytonema sp. NUACC26 TaxID=3140176 RepID=UPI0034DC065E
MAKTVQSPIDNRLLSVLPDEVYRKLLPHLETVPLSFKQVLFQPGRSIDYVYFPIHSVVSLLTTMADGTQAEVGLIGYEGMVGISVVLGIPTTPLRAVVQISGEAVRMRTDIFKTVMCEKTLLQEVLLQYTHVLIVQISQSVACNNFHSVEQRMCRWLLMIHDRMRKNKFPLTQESLSQILGVRRASVGAVARKLRTSRLIDYDRGEITILNRLELETIACECYDISRTELDRWIRGN